MSAPDDLAGLRAYLTSLESAWAEFEHQSRRFGDARERAGGILGAAEADIKQLYRNMADNEKEQARIRAKIAALNTAGTQS